MAPPRDMASEALKLGYQIVMWDTLKNFCRSIRWMWYNSKYQRTLSLYVSFATYYSAGFAHSLRKYFAE